MKKRLERLTAKGLFQKFQNIIVGIFGPAAPISPNYQPLLTLNGARKEERNMKHVTQMVWWVVDGTVV